MSFLKSAAEQRFDKMIAGHKAPEQRRADMLVQRELGPLGVNVSKFDESPSQASWRELHEQRASIRRAMNKMSDRAANDGNRDFNEAEQLAWDTCLQVANQLNIEIDSREANGHREGRAFLGNSYGRAGSLSSGRQGNRDPMALRSGELLADLAATGPGEDVRLGSLLRASITGDWNGLEGFRAQQATDTGAGGGFMVPSHLSARIIDLSRAQARVVQAGAMTVPITGATNFGTVEQDPTANWKAENQPITESEMVFGSRTFTPKTLAVLVRSSIELIEDAPNIERLIESAISAELALKLDRMCLIGDGVGKPMGLYYADGINRLSPSGGAGPLADYSLLSKAVEAVRNNNAEPGAFLLAARTSGELDRLVDGQGNPLRAPRSIQERDLLATNQIPIDMEVSGSPAVMDASAVFTGQWEDLYLAIRTNMIIEASRVADTAFKNMQVLIRGYLRADAFAVRPAHFAVVQGITPPA